MVVVACVEIGDVLDFGRRLDLDVQLAQPPKDELLDRAVLDAVDDHRPLLEVVGPTGAVVDGVAGSHLLRVAAYGQSCSSAGADVSPPKSSESRRRDVPPHRITYLFVKRALPESGLRLGNRRVFTAEDGRAVAKLLGLEWEADTEKKK